MPRRMPNTIMVVATTQRERSTVSIWFWKRTPSTTIGMLPKMMYQPSLAFGSLRGTRPKSDLNQVEMMRTMSCQK